MHAGTHVGPVQKTNISAGPKNGGRTVEKVCRVLDVGVDEIAEFINEEDVK